MRWLQVVEMVGVPPGTDIRRKHAPDPGQDRYVLVNPAHVAAAHPVVLDGARQGYLLYGPTGDMIGWTADADMHALVPEAPTTADVLRGLNIDVIRPYPGRVLRSPARRGGRAP